MAQPQLQQGEGPIALVLEPARELAVQTYHVPWAMGVGVSHLVAWGWDGHAWLPLGGG